MILSHLKIRTRIYAGFGSLILLGLAVAAVDSWICSLNRQTLKLNSLAGNFKNVAAAVRSEAVIALILLHARDEPAAELKAAFHQHLDEVRQSLTAAKATSLSATRNDIHQSVLDRLDRQAQCADRSFDMGHTMVENRDRMISGGEALTNATTRLGEAP